MAAYKIKIGPNQWVTVGGATGWSVAVSFSAYPTLEIRSSQNVDHIEKLKTGVYRIFFETPAPNLNYAVLANGRFNSFTDNNIPNTGVYRDGQRTLTYIDVSSSQGIATDFQDLELFDVLMFDPANFSSFFGVESPASSGGGAGNIADVPPAEPTAWDDEFDGEALDAKWTPILPALSAPLVSFGNGQITFNDIQIRPIGQDVPAGEWEFTCKFMIPLYVEEYANFGMVISNGPDNFFKTFTYNWGGGDLIGFQLGKDAGYQGNAYGGRRTLQVSALYMKIRRFLDGGVMKVSFTASNDGINFSPFVLDVETNMLPNGIARIGIYGANQAPSRVVFRAEWFRKTG